MFHGVFHIALQFLNLWCFTPYLASAGQRVQQYRSAEAESLLRRSCSAPPMDRASLQHVPAAP